MRCVNLIQYHHSFINQFQFQLVYGLNSLALLTTYSNFVVWIPQQLLIQQRNNCVVKFKVSLQTNNKDK